MSEPEADVPISLAATVLVLREVSHGPELLLVQRASELAFHGGAWVFPGGRVDASDRVSDDPLETARRAAVREAFEEAQLVLEPTELVALSHWTTPIGRPRRFATWFFATQLSTAHDVVVDGAEIRAHRWLTAAEALALHARGELELPPPTFVTLCQLRPHTSAAEVLATLSRSEPPVYVPRQHPVAGGFVSLYHGDVAYEDGVVERPGPRHRLHMLESGWSYERSPELP